MQQLSKKDIKNLNEEVEKFGLVFGPKQRVLEKDDLFFVDGKPLLMKVDGVLVPTLFNDLKFKSVYVDKGAIPFVVKGADIMAPGISSFDDFDTDEIVIIKDDTHKKALAIGMTLVNSDELKSMGKGKAIKTYHFVGDKVWAQSKY